MKQSSALWGNNATLVEAVVPARATDDLSELVGQRVGNYIIDRPLARGGMAVVFVAKHPTLGREVAIKFLCPSLQGDLDLAERFIQEAKVTASLAHPNVVEILDFGELDRRPYYMMELLQGDDLREKMNQKARFHYADVVRHVEQICEALEAAHAVGVVHRDLKPDNIFVLGQDPLRLKLMDFGVAKARQSPRVGHTLHGQVLGTPTHMSPEQALGQSDRISPRSDLYAVGVIAYEMLTGRLPFYSESSTMLLAMHIRDPVPPIRSVNPEVPRRVAELVESCMAKDPMHRPKSARAFAAQLLTVSRVAERDTDRDLQVAHELALKLARIENDANNGTVVVAVARASEVAPVEKQEPALPGALLPRAHPPQPTALNFPDASASPAAPSVPVFDAPALREATADAQPATPALDEPASAPPDPDTQAEGSVSPPGRLELPPLLSEITDSSTGNGHELSEDDVDTLDRLLRRMQRRGDFPSFLSNLAEIVTKADADSHYSAAQLAEALRKDFGLTAKLLRIVNTAFLNRFGGRVYSVNQAVVILGFDSVRAIASGVSVYKVPGTPEARGKHKAVEGKYNARLAESAINSLVSGEIARLLAERASLKAESEVAMMSATFRNLGQHLVMQYLPDEYAQIEALVSQSGLSLCAASERILGASLRKLSLGVMQRWQLPKNICDAISVQVRSTDRLENEVDRLAALARFSTDLCDIIARGNQETWTRLIQRLLDQNKNLLDLDETEVSDLIEAVSKSFDDRFAALLGPHATRSRFLAGARRFTGRNESPKNATSEPAAEPELAALELGIQSLIEGQQKRRDPDALLTQALKLLGTTLCVGRILLLVPAPDRKHLEVQATFGPEGEALQRELKLPLSRTGGVFASAARTGKALVISDALSERTMKRVPQQYYEVLGSPCFVILPCVSMGYPTTLLLLDANSPSKLPCEERMAATKSLRTLLVQLAHKAHV